MKSTQSAKRVSFIRKVGWLSVASMLSLALLAPAANAQTGHTDNGSWDSVEQDCTGGPNGNITPVDGMIAWIFVHNQVDGSGVLTANFQNAGTLTANSYVLGTIKYIIWTNSPDTLLTFSDTLDSAKGTDQLVLSHVCGGSTTTTTSSTESTGTSETSSTESTGTTESTSTETTGTQTVSSTTDQSSSTETTGTESTGTTESTSTETTGTESTGTTESTSTETTGTQTVSSTTDQSTTDQSSSTETTGTTESSSTETTGTQTVSSTTDQSTTDESTTTETSTTGTQSVEAETDVPSPAVTLPPTDTLSGPAAPSTDSWRILLIVGAALLASVLVLSPAKASRRR